MSDVVDDAVTSHGCDDVEAIGYALRCQLSRVFWRLWPDRLDQVLTAEDSSHGSVPTTRELRR